MRKPVAPIRRPAPLREVHASALDHVVAGVTQGSYAEVSGLDSETEVIEYQDGNDLILHKR